MLQLPPQKGMHIRVITKLSYHIFYLTLRFVIINISYYISILFYLLFVTLFSSGVLLTYYSLDVKIRLSGWLLCNAKWTVFQLQTYISWWEWITFQWDNDVMLLGHWYSTSPWLDNHSSRKQLGSFRASQFLFSLFYAAEWRSCKNKLSSPYSARTGGIQHSRQTLSPLHRRWSSIKYK